jgi:hypothetical protein
MTLLSQNQFRRFAESRHSVISGIIAVVRAVKNDPSAPGSARGLRVTPRIANHKRISKIDIRSVSERDEHARFGLATLTVVPVIVGTNLDRFDAKPAHHRLIHAVQGSRIHPSTRDVRLIGYHEKSQSGRL